MSRSRMRLRGLMRQRKQHMRTGFTLVDASIAETPVSFVAHVTAPVTVVGPDAASRAKCSCFQPASRIIRRQRLSPIGPARNRWRWHVAIRGEHVRSLQGAVSLLSHLLPLAPCGVPKAKPVLASLAGSVALETNVPLPASAGCTVVMDLIFYVLFVAPRTCNGRFWKELRSGTSMPS